jgi:hypothetical protein
MGPAPEIFVARPFRLAWFALLLFALGCAASSPREGAATQPAQAGGDPSDAMASSDTERAEAALERDRVRRSGNRPPADPPRPPVVNQPRTPARGRP